MLAKTNSCVLTGIEGVMVEVEVDIAYGLPGFNIVGLPEISIRESRERVKTAIKNSGYTFPMERLVVNLAPADIKKEGTGLDLPIAIGILAASEVIPKDHIGDYLVTGELSLDGRIRPVKAILSYAITAKEQGFKGIIVPQDNAGEAALVEGMDILPVTDLAQIVEFFNGFKHINPYILDFDQAASNHHDNGHRDLYDVKGQQKAKRALEIAAAGSHHLLMTGPPGSGKSMLARRLVTILPELTMDQAIDVTRIYSAMGLLNNNRALSFQKPFRAPHHTISDAGLAGGGLKPLPGEITLAHNGVLFLDELPEFKRNVLEVLRQPLEDGKVSISRAGVKVVYPSRFMLVAAMNPCPCGYLSDPKGKCTCTHPQIQRYRSKVSGPLLDRMDIQVEVPKVAYKDLSLKEDGEHSIDVKKRVDNAIRRQTRRLSQTGISSNSQMTAPDLKQFCPLDNASEKILEKAVDVLGLSVRACHSVIKVARTIADLGDHSDIQRHHLAEAVQYRSFDR